MRLQFVSKALLMLAFLPILWAVLHLKSRRIWLPILGGTLAAFYLLLVQPVIGATRERMLRTREAPLEAISAVVSDDSNAVQIEDSLNHYLSREFDPVPSGFLYAEARRRGFREGETLEYLKYAFIPRVIYPEKPQVTRCSWFTAYLGLSRSEATATTCTGITAPAELYWNFGYPGVVGGMAIVAVLAAVLMRLAGPRPQDSAVRFLLYMNIVFLLPNMGEFGSALTGYVSKALVFGSFVLFERITSRRQSTNVGIMGRSNRFA